VAERAFHETPAADACFLVGGGVLFASAFLQWVAHGPGSGLRGHALVDAIVALGRHVPALSSGRLTILWYLVPALGTASWIACGLRGARSRASRIVAGAALVVTVVVAAAFVHLVGLSRLGWGPKVAVAGAVGLCFAAWWPRRNRVGVSAGPGSGPSPGRP
jgi:hypothetical protein